MPKLCESAVEKMAIKELQSLGYTYIADVDLVPDALNPERNSYAMFSLWGGFRWQCPS
jgi:type I restriction enzyme R subunit